MKLSILIVNYKTPQLVLQCLQSCFAFSMEGVEVLVIDNASQDGLQEQLIAQFGNVKFLQMGYNAGFARANNAGIKASAGEAVLLLNSDTIVLEDAINKSFARLMQSRYVACGVQLLNEDGSPQISGNFAMQGGLNYLLPLPYLGNFLKWLSSFFKVQRPSIPEVKGMAEVDWVNGAYLMVKRKAIEKAGLLDEDFFLYAEEAEWCSRLKKEGPLCIFGDEHVVHLQGQTANETFASSGQGYFNLFDKKGLQIMVSNFVRIRKQWGIAWFLFDLFMYILAVPAFAMGLLIEKIIASKNSDYTIKQWKGFAKNVGELCKLVPVIISNKPYFYKVL